MRNILLIVPVVLLIITCGGPGTMEEYEAEGKKAFLREDYATARDYLGKAVSMKSSGRDILYFLGLSYQREYMLDSALFYLKRADLLYPNDREVNRAIYPVAAELKEWENAAKAINVLIATGDDISQYRERLADLNAKMGNETVALIHARELLKMEPDNPNRYFQAIVLAHQNDSFDLALRWIDEAESKFGQDIRFSANRGIMYAEKQQFKKAEEILRPVVTADSAAINKLYLANALSGQDSRAKKEEALGLYIEVKEELVFDPEVDSAITALREELGVEQ